MCKKGVLKNFAKYTGKHLYQSLFFNKVAGLRPVTLLIHLMAVSDWKQNIETYGNTREARQNEVQKRSEAVAGWCSAKKKLSQKISQNLLENTCVGNYF